MYCYASHFKSLVAASLLYVLPAITYADTTTGLVAWWKLDDGAGTSATDSSGNGNTGTLTNAPSWVAGNVGTGALSFTAASNQYVVKAGASNLPLLGTDPFSISQWIYLTSTPSDGTVFGGFGTSGNARFIIQWCCGCGIYYHGNGADACTGVAFDLNAWQLITVTYDGSQMTIYKNASVILGPAAHAQATVFAPEISIGHQSLQAWYLYPTGKVDDLRIYNRALTKEDVGQLYYIRPSATLGGGTVTLGGGTTKW